MNIVDKTKNWLRENYADAFKRNAYTEIIEYKGKPITTRDKNNIWIAARHALGKVEYSVLIRLIGQLTTDYIPVTESRNGVRIKYGMHLGKRVLILPHVTGTEGTVQCPFCNVKHSHTEPGHRQPHCNTTTHRTRKRNYEVIKHPSGALLFKDDGYLIVECEPKSKIYFE